MNIIKKRKIWFILSGAVISIGIIGLFFGGLKLGLDFTGGSYMELEGVNSLSKVEEVLSKHKIEKTSLDKLGDKVIIKTKILSEETHNVFLEDLQKENSDNEIREIRFETVGPTVSRDIKTKAYISISLALVIIVFYIAWSFKGISRELSSWKYGISAIIALIHDVLFVLGAFSILGIFFPLEADSLFVTALLTIISFSVYDTIVVFDRIRENIKKMQGDNFEDIVTVSLSETIVRSLNTSLVVIIVILSLFLFGGDTIKSFVLALLLGMVVGTYSSLFIASPLLVVWKNLEKSKQI